MVTTGAIEESEWFGEELNEASKSFGTYSYERGSDVGVIKSIKMWSNHSIPYFKMETTTNPQCVHHEDVVDSWESIPDG